MREINPRVGGLPFLGFIRKCLRWWPCYCWSSSAQSSYWHYWHKGGRENHSCKKQMCLPSGFRIALSKDHPHRQYYHCCHHQGLQETNAWAIFFRSSSFQPKKTGKCKCSRVKSLNSVSLDGQWKGFLQRWLSNFPAECGNITCFEPPLRQIWFQHKRTYDYQGNCGSGPGGSSPGCLVLDQLAISGCEARSREHCSLSLFGKVLSPYLVVIVRIIYITFIIIIMIIIMMNLVIIIMSK